MTPPTTRTPHKEASRARKALLDDLYAQLNRRSFVHPDPLEFLYRYTEVGDREIAGLIASSLAYGNVKVILRSVGSVLGKMDSPVDFVVSASKGTFERVFSSFKHRFTTGSELVGLLLGMKRVLREHGSLENCVRLGLRSADNSAHSGLSYLVHALNPDGSFSSLLPCPNLGSACKRLHLFLRWMVRSDAVDPGGWTVIAPEQLIIPLDTHMFRLSRALGFTNRRSPDLKAALEITQAFRELSPCDPLRYDFALTRLGMRPGLGYDLFLQQWRETAGS
jgi:uncharacterized protein (TIGR02757 family)